MSIACGRRIPCSRERAEYYDTLARTVFFPIYPVIARQILDRTGIWDGHCLDIGCGPANLAIALASFSDLTVTAMDTSRAMCRIAEANIRRYGLGTRVRAVYGNACAIPCADASMDLVVSRGAFYFWENLSGGLSECMRVLRPGGRACIGNGFGTAGLRDRIALQMRELEPGGWRSAMNGTPSAMPARNNPRWRPPVYPPVR